MCSRTLLYLQVLLKVATSLNCALLKSLLQKELVYFYMYFRYVQLLQVEKHLPYTWKLQLQTSSSSIKQLPYQFFTLNAIVPTYRISQYNYSQLLSECMFAKLLYSTKFCQNKILPNHSFKSVGKVDLQQYKHLVKCLWWKTWTNLSSFTFYIAYLISQTPLFVWG